MYDKTHQLYLLLLNVQSCGLLRSLEFLIFFASFFTLGLRPEHEFQGGILRPGTKVISGNDAGSATANSPTVDVLIIGGGMAGTSLAIKLQKLGKNILLIEKEPRLGGKIHSCSNIFFSWEVGAHTFRPTASFLTFLSDLEILEDVIASAPSLPRYILYKHSFNKVNPLFKEIIHGFYLSRKAKLQTLRGILPFYFSIPGKQESFQQFCSRCFGTEVFEKIFDPFITGIHAGDSSKLSARAILHRYPHSFLPNFFKWITRCASFSFLAPQNYWKNVTTFKKFVKLMNCKNSQCSFQKGLCFIFEKAFLSLNATSSVMVNSSVTTLKKLENGEYHAKIEKTSPSSSNSSVYISARSVVVATASDDAANLLQTTLGDAASSALRTLPYVPVVVLSLAYTDESFRMPLHGFGYLISKENNMHTLGVIWYSSIFPHTTKPGYQLISALVGGAHHPECLTMENATLVAQVDNELKHEFLFKNASNPIVLSIKRWEKGIPQFHVGDENTRAVIFDEISKHPGLFLVGDYVSGVALGKIVEFSYRLAYRISAYLRWRK